MSWERLSKRLSDLPWIICGPILRRVEPGLVTVWFATRLNVQSIRLTLSRVPSSLSASAQGGWATSTLDSWVTTAHTLQIGCNLWFHLVTATLSDAETSPERLKSDDNIRYNIHMAAGGVESSLIDMQLAVCRNELSPGDISFPVPRFVYPPESSDIRIAHGSCRKPTGEGIDALAYVERLLSPKDSAPHLLVLTGDQIYADGVGDTLLFLLQDAADALLGWRDPVPSPYPDLQTLDPLLLMPGYRTLWAQTAGFQFTYPPRSHLLRVCEYLMMHLFVWSTTLWPRDIPTREDLLATEVLDEKIRNWYLQHWSEPLEKERRWEVVAIDRFRARIAEVQVVLANVPTYMVVDDHDVTDDWGVSRWWVERVAANRLGRHTVRSGIVAAWLCQSLGNDPSVLASAPGGRLWTACGEWFAAQGKLTESLAKTVDEIIGLPDPKQTSVSALRAAIPFHFRVVYGTTELIGLDTRCSRAYDVAPGEGASPFPILIDPDGGGVGSLDAQLPAVDLSQADGTSDRVTVVICPAPLFGYTVLEQIQELYGSPEVQQLQQIVGELTGQSSWLPLGLGLSLPSRLAYKDTEAWGLNDTGREAFLARLLSRLTGVDERYCARIVLLSGDVHYAMSSRFEMRATDLYRERGARRAVFAQLTSSSLRNESSTADRRRRRNKKSGEKRWKKTPYLALPKANPSNEPLLMPAYVRSFKRVKNADAGYGSFADATTWLHKLGSVLPMLDEHHVGAAHLLDESWTKASGWHTAVAKPDATASYYPRPLSAASQNQLGISADMKEIESVLKVHDNAGRSPAMVRDAGIYEALRSYIGIKVAPDLKPSWAYQVIQAEGHMTGLSAMGQEMIADAVNLVASVENFGPAELLDLVSGEYELEEPLRAPGQALVGYNNVGLVSFDDGGQTVKHSVFWGIEMDDSESEIPVLRATQRTTWTLDLTPDTQTDADFIARMVDEIEAQS